MNKLEQRLSDLTKLLASARRDKDQDAIEMYEDEIAEIEFELEEEYNRRFDSFEDFEQLVRWKVGTLFWVNVVFMVAAYRPSFFVSVAQLDRALAF